MATTEYGRTQAGTSDEIQSERGHQGMGSDEATCRAFCLIRATIQSTSAGNLPDSG